MKISESQRNYFRNDINITEILDENENILWQGKPAKKAFLFGSFLNPLPVALIFGIATSFIVWALAKKDFFNWSSITAYITILFFVVLSAPAWGWLALIFSAEFRRKKTDYVFTDNRFIIKKCVIGGVYIYVKKYDDILCIHYIERVSNKTFGAGNIVITCLNEKETLLDIDSPEATSKELKKIVKEYKTNKK